MTVGTPAGATGANSGADQIWTFDGFTWKKYYFYKRGSTTKWCLSGTTTEIGDDIVLKSGQSFYFVRSDTGDSTLTFAGAVVPLSSKVAYAVKASSTTAMAYPWPESMKIKDFQQFNSAPAGATGANSGADQIWTFNGFTWTKYYYYKRGSTTKWCLAGSTTEIGDDVVIPSAAGFFFVRSDTADATITFAR